ncbi:MAG: alpha-2-macroglobulin, partial [Candidatus Riflebacteria bacterium]|nr:alpha-2-macroglobulin [Candidatus Riflebacteria bacterium]
PELLTDERGRASVELSMADSITTWRITGLASTKKGDLGSFTAGLRAFQEFFVDLDLPVALTKGDEIALPVAVFNYLDRPQEVKLELERGSWFELAGDPVRLLRLGPGEVTAERFRIKAVRAGTHTLTVYGLGSRRNDAIRREVQVVPKGRRVMEGKNGMLSDRLEETVSIPATSLDQMERLFVRIHPSAASQVVEGLDTLIQAPYG